MIFTHTLTHTRTCTHTHTHTHARTHTHTHTQHQQHRAVQTNNVKVVLKLLDEFKVNPLISDPKTGESILHTACRMKSDLRFFVANRYPNLFRKRNLRATAEQPLHVACFKNDISFVSWLFKSILAQESAMDEVSSLSVDLISLPRCESLASVQQNSLLQVQQPFTQGFRRSPERHMTHFQLSPKVLQGVHKPKNEESNEDQHLPLSTPDESELVFSFDSIKTNSSNSCLDSSLPRSQNCDQGIIDPSASTRLTSRRLSNQIMKISDILKESPLTTTEVFELLPSLTGNGDSVFHILARENCPELLRRVFKVAELVHWGINLDMLLFRSQLSVHLPIEEAILAKSVECIEIIVQFMTISGLLPNLLPDELLLSNAVLTADLDVVKVLIYYGFHKGLQPAISQAVETKHDEILRVLLYCQTEVVNAFEYSHITQHNVRALHHNKGGIKWESCGLEHIDPSWFSDCYSAVDSVSKAFNLLQVLLSTDDNYHFFQQLGRDCIHYFSKAVTSPRSKHNFIFHHLVSITEVNLNKNKLTAIPIELVQLPSLLVLKLSNNKLNSLPSSEKLWGRLYTAPISLLNLDHNCLETLPESLFRDLAHSLTELSASHNLLQNLPPGLWISPRLKVLNLAHNHLSQLHYLSNPRYFNEPVLSETVVNSFTVTSGVLTCNVVRDENLHQIEEYLHRLADFQHTVCVIKFPYSRSRSTHNHSTMYDVMGIHLSRIEFYQTSLEERDAHKLITPTIQGEPLFPVSDGEERERSLCDLESLDLSHNFFSEFPWDLACIAPQLHKLYMQNNQIQDLDIVHSVPRDLCSMSLAENKISNLRDHRPKSLPCGHPFRLLTLPESKSHDRHCWHCKHKTLDNLSLLSIGQNQLQEFPTVQLISKDSQTSDYNSIVWQPLYPILSVLSLEHNKLPTFPSCLHYLTQLSFVNLSHNELSELPPEAGLMNGQQLYILKMDGMSLRNIPSSLLQKPSPKLLLDYLKAIQQK